MSKFVAGIVEIAAGVAAIVGGIVLTVISGGALTPLAFLLFNVGVSLATAGTGTLLSGSGGGGTSAQAGVAVAIRNPIQPWNIVYGRQRVGGTVIYVHEFGDSDKYLDMVIALAANQCQSVDALLFDNQLVQIDPSDNTSFTPVQQTVNIATISRTNNVVTVVLNANIPYLAAGYDFFIQNVTGDHSLNGKFQVEQIISQVVGSPGSITFTYICGGTTDTFSGQGQVKTAWADFGRKVYMESVLGNHTSTFTGMLSGTPNDGDTGDLIQDGSNPWTSAHVGYGHTMVFLRLHYNDTIFAGGIPSIGFLVRGKNDIFDPRTGTTGYTENAALCWTDHLSNTTWGFGAAYHTEIPDSPLIAAANICDEAVALANGSTEPRYACNGQFPLSVSRGEISRNLLTACAGKYTYTGGQFVIYPAAWRGSSPVTVNDMGQMADAFDWALPGIRSLFNGVKGTFLSPGNRWQVSDFPPYAQDALHGYISDANLTADGGDRRWKDIELPFTISNATAQRIAKIELERVRQFQSAKFVFNLSGYKIMPMDVLSITIPFLGWTNKLVEVTSTRFVLRKVANGDNDTVALGVEVEVIETTANIYNWSTTEENSPQGYRQTTAPTNTFPDATEPPSQIQHFVITGGFPTYNTSTFTLQGTGDFPVALNNFAGCKLWNVLSGDFDHPIPLGDMPVQDGATNWKWSVTAPIPDADQTWQIYAVTYGVDPVTGLVVSGPWLPVTSPTINETPHVTVAISANVPGNVTALSASVDNTDPLVSRVTLTSTAPSPLHDFDGVEIWDQDVTGGVIDYPHDYGVAKWGGSGSLVTIVEIARLAYAASVKLWEVSRNPAITETPVFTGGGASPNVTVTIPARTSTSVPAPVVGAVTTPTVIFSSLIGDNEQHWGVSNCAVAAPPSGAWVSGQTVLVQLVRISPLGANGEQFISELWEKSTTPSSTNSFPTGSSPYLFEHVPDFPRPTFGNNETWRCRITPKNSAGDLSAYTESATFTVIGGGGGTAAPNVIALGCSVVLSGQEFFIDTVTTLDVNYLYDNYLEHRIVSDVGSSDEVDNWSTHFDNGDFAASNPAFNVSTRQLTWRIGPFGRPDTGTQQWAVRARVYNGKGNQTPSPFQSLTLIIAAVTTTASTGLSTICTGCSATLTGTHTIDGMQMAIISCTFTFPTSDEAKEVWIDAIDLTSGRQFNLRQYTIDSFSTGSHTVAFDVPAVVTTYRILWYSINDNDFIMSPQPFQDVPVTATTGQIKAGRIDPTHLTPELQLDSSSGSTKLGVASVSVAKLTTGQLVVQMSLVSAGAGIIVTGSNFITTINTTVGVQVFSSLNNQIAALTSGYLRINGTGANSAFTGQFDATQAFLGHSNGSFVRIIGNNGAGGFANFVDQFGNSCLIGALNLHLQSAGSVVTVNGVYKMYIGGIGTPQTVIDINGRICGLDDGPVTFGGITFLHSMQVVCSGVVRVMPLI